MSPPALAELPALQMATAFHLVSRMLAVEAFNGGPFSGFAQRYHKSASAEKGG